MERIAVYGAGTIGSCQATLIIGNGLPRSECPMTVQGTSSHLGCR